MAANKVFGCDDLRKKILTYIPNRCIECGNIMFLKKYSHNNKLYNDDVWKKTRNKKFRNHCNWCVYYVFGFC